MALVMLEIGRLDGLTISGSLHKLRVSRRVAIVASTDDGLGSTVDRQVQSG